MRQAVRLIFVWAVFCGLVGCEQVTAFVKNMQAPEGLPDDLINLMTKSVPVSSGRITYPRLAVSLTNTHGTNEIGLGTADCGHFKITEWQSETIKQYREFDACILRRDEQAKYKIDHLVNVAYLYNPEDQWSTLEQFGGKHSPDYQPISVHWSEGPQVAQYFLPPPWVTGSKTEIQTNLVEVFLTHIGVLGMTVDPRVWFYQIDQAS